MKLTSRLTRSLHRLAPVLTIVFLALRVGSVCTTVLAQTPDPAASSDPASSTTEPTVINKSDGKALGITFTNAIVNYVNNARTVTFTMNYDFLPEGEAFTNRVSGIEPYKIVLKNSDLPHPSRWLGGIRNAKVKYAILDALGMTEDELKNFHATSPPASPVPDHYTQRLANPGSMAALGASGIFNTSNDSVTTKLDHLVLALLLRGNGVAYNVTIPPGTTVQGKSERDYSSHVVWNINVYPLLPASLQAQQLYRISITAGLDRAQTLTFPSLTQTKVKVKSNLSFKPSIATLGLATNTLSLSDTELNAIAAASEPVGLLPTTVLGGSTVEGIIKFVGGSSLEEVTKKSLFSASSRTSVYYGGLVGRGDISQVVGVNTLVTKEKDEFAGGILLGIAPERNKGVFFGPSLQAGPVSLAFGGFAVEVDRVSGGKKTHVQGAGAVAFDLLRLLGAKKDTQTIALQNNRIGGGSSDEVAALVFALRTEIHIAPELTPEQIKGIRVALRRIATFSETGEQFPVGDKSTQETAALDIAAYVGKPTQTLLLHRGMWVLDITTPTGVGVGAGPTGNQPLSTQAFAVGAGGQNLNVPLKIFFKRALPVPMPQ